MKTTPKLLVSIDTEPDDEWSGKAEATTENIRRLPRLQSLFDQYGVRPTYLVSYCVAQDPGAAAILREISESGRCEIGAHLHAWRTPPAYPLPHQTSRSHPYLFQYPRDIQRAKFATLHDALTRAFGSRPVSHRAGKYGLDGHGVTLLKEFGYKADSSVTPMLDWYDDVQAGTPGPDFRAAPTGVYELSETGPCAAGRSGVLEVPVSIGLTKPLPVFLQDWFRAQRPTALAVRALGKLYGIRKRWFRPFLGVPFHEIELAARWLLDRGAGFLNMMFHSSELIPNSQWCKTEDEVTEFLGRIDAMVRMAVRLGCTPGLTLSEAAVTFKGGDACRKSS